MKKNRYLLCLLAAGFMLYFAIPRMNFSGGGSQKWFAYSWILLALCVAAGNLSGLLYTPRSRKNIEGMNRKPQKKGSRSFLE